ncbi:uncharacterized protein [Chlorocebus sabaeus]|uniref:uncharacterized protein n=1 Tax=Chlorocebus sabaeus TaxID=60711 RepID=UPI003BF9DA4D
MKLDTQNLGPTAPPCVLELGSSPEKTLSHLATALLHRDLFTLLVLGLSICKLEVLESRNRSLKLGIFMEIDLIQMSSPDPICLQVPGITHHEPLTLDRWTLFALLGQGHGAGSTVDMEHEHVDIWKFTDRLRIVCITIVSFSPNSSPTLPSSPPPPSPTVFPRFPSPSPRPPLFSQHCSLSQPVFLPFSSPLPTSFPAHPLLSHPSFSPLRLLSPTSSSPLSPPFFFPATRPLPFSLPTLFFPLPSPLSNRLLPHLLPFPSSSFPTLLLSHPSLPQRLLPTFFSPSLSSTSSLLLLPHRGLPASSAALSPPSSSRTFFSPAVFFPFSSVFFPSVSPPPRSTGSCGGGFSSHVPLPTASSTLLSTRSLPLSTFPPIPAAASSRRSLFSPPPPSPHRLLPAYYCNRFLPHPAPFSSHVFPPLRSSVCLPRSSHYPLLLSPSSPFLAKILFSTVFFRLHLPTFFSQQRLPAALFSPRPIFSLPLPTVFSPRRLLPSPSSPRAFPTTVFYPPVFFPHTVFFPCPPTMSQQCLSQSSSHSLLSLSPSSSFPASYSPPFSSPPHHFLPVFVSPPSRSSDFLPRFSLPAPSSPRFVSPPSSPPIVFSPPPFSALSRCLSLRSPPRVRAPVFLRPVCLCAQVDP